jgi:hypothetical protein
MKLIDMRSKLGNDLSEWYQRGESLTSHVPHLHGNPMALY